MATAVDLDALLGACLGMDNQVGREVDGWVPEPVPVA